MVIPAPNLYAAWIGFLLGAVAGSLQGLFFHREDWLGGYASWTRRMLRLGHVSFFGIGLLNLAFALTLGGPATDPRALWCSRLFLLAAVAMPVLCYVSAFRPSFRHLFFVPVLSVIAGSGTFLWRLVRP